MKKRDAYLDLDDDIVPDGGSVRRPMLLMDGRRFSFDAENHQPHYAHPTGAVHDARKVRTAARNAYLRRLGDAWRVPGHDANAGGFTCPRCHGTGIDPDDDSDTDRCERCGGSGYIEAPNNSSSAQRNDAGFYPDDPRLRSDAEMRNARAAATASYHAMCARLRDAWRTPVSDAPQPDNSSSNAEWRRHMRSVPDPGDPNENLMRRHLTTETNAGAQAERDRVWEEYRNRLSTAWQTGQTNPRRADVLERRLEQERGRFERKQP
jgi:hypothetical protein